MKKTLTLSLLSAPACPKPAWTVVPVNPIDDNSGQAMGALHVWESLNKLGDRMDELGDRMQELGGRMKELKDCTKEFGDRIKELGNPK